MLRVFVLLILFISLSPAQAFSLNSKFYQIYPEFKDRLNKRSPELIHNGYKYEFIDKAKGLGWFEDLVLVKDLESGRVRELYLLISGEIMSFAHSFDIDLSRDSEKNYSNLYHAINEFIKNTDIKPAQQSFFNKKHIENAIHQILNKKLLSKWIKLETYFTSSTNRGSNLAPSPYYSSGFYDDYMFYNIDSAIAQPAYFSTREGLNLSYGIGDPYLGIPDNRLFVNYNLNLTNPSFGFNQENEASLIKKQGIYIRIKDSNKYSKAYLMYSSEEDKNKYLNLLESYLI